MPTSAASTFAGERVSRPAIVFIGFMGAGKSTATAAVGELTGRAEDIDDLIVARVGMPVRDFFDARGEEAFREVEREVAVGLLREADGGAIALGGGSALSAEVGAELGRHIVVWLDVDADTAWERVSTGDERPLVARGREAFDSLFAARRPRYEELADAVLPVGDGGMILRALRSIQALADLPSGARMLWATSASGEYPVVVGRGLLGAGWWPLGERRFGITDTAVAPLYADRLPPLESLVEIPPGEEAKTMAEAERVLRELARAGMSREDHVVALGGGVVGDLAGFCAHTYQRGVPVVQVPTTLVSQVDSAYGGKTGVDLPEGKNYAGAYHLPAAVIADTGTLATLPAEELAAGFVEVLKTGLLAGGSLWERVRAIGPLDPAELDDVIFACARHKCEVVAADERDAGLRHTLNFGHTVGHAIEAASGYARYRHGEAVGLGLLAALRLSEAPELREEVGGLLAAHGLPVELERKIEIAAILDALQRDKKRTAAGVGFVLLAAPGAPRVGQKVDPAKVRLAVEELYER
jgi:shikimate kinase/3-dehydroquinate synthase